MYHFTPWQILIFALLAILAIVPSAKILQRMGYSGWWALLAPISPLNIVGLWLLASAQWPRIKAN